jgi:sulfur carrier protein ThiS
MTTDAYAPESDPKTQVLSRLVTALAEDAIFAFAAGSGGVGLEDLGKRRGEAYSALLGGHALNRMADRFDHWVVEMTRAMAPIAPPVWMPMNEVIKERVTLEVGARGLRSLFSSKPSDKDVQRVKRLGTLAARILRAVFAADGPIEPEEARTVAGFIGSLGLPSEDVAALYNEAPVAIESLEIYGEIEPAVGKAIMRGAWLAAAWDQIDPREEEVIRKVAPKIQISESDMESARAEAIARVDARRTAGLAAVDAVRYVLHDRVPGTGVTLAAQCGHLMLPRKYREEALAQVGHNAPITLAKRYKDMATDEKVAVLGLSWAAALAEDPTMARRALLRARHDRVAQDLGEDGAKVRLMLDTWFQDVLAPAAFPMSAPAGQS